MSQPNNFVFLALAALLLGPPPSARACSAFEFGGASQGGVAHNVDWYTQLGAAGALFVNARGMEKQGELFGESDTPAHWISKYGSLTYTITGREFPAGGRNEAGLSVQALMFSGRFPTAAESSLPALGATQWVQYQLDTAATLQDVIANAAKIRPVSKSLVHYFVCDRQHQCAVFQYIDAQLKQFYGAGLPTPNLTNSSYADSVQAWHDCQGGKCTFATNSLERFSKAAEARAKFSGGDPLPFAASTLQNVAQTGAITTRFSFVDVPEQKGSPLYFTTGGNWNNWQKISLAALDFTCERAGRYLEIDSTLTGEQAGNLNPYSSAIQTKLAAQMPMPDSIRQALVALPSAKTRCVSPPAKRR
ncbi:MAG: hypothetical protein ACXVCI_05185 [Bdellovibrionota bacterium]